MYRQLWIWDGGGGEKLIQMEICVSNVRKKIKNHQPPLFTFLSFSGDGEGGGCFWNFTFVLIGIF